MKYSIKSTTNKNGEVLLEQTIETPTSLNRDKIPGYVYVLKSGPYYKIGQTQYLDKRIRRLTIQLPFPVEVVATIPCDDCFLAEDYLHRTFSSFRRNGEWFELDEICEELVRDMERIIYVEEGGYCKEIGERL